MSETIDFAALAEPFPANEVGWKAQTVKDGRALAVAYIDARDVQDRLDAVARPANWQDSYTVLPDGNVVCRLSLRVGDEWITKEDVGGESDQHDEGDKRKAAFSDALKRAAIKWGVGRYLYRLPHSWVDYDPQKKQIKNPPQLPAWALPASHSQTPAKPKPAPHVAPAQANTLPKTGEEMRQRLQAYDARLASQNLCKVGDLVKHVVTHGVKAGYAAELDTWTGPAITFAVEETKAFEAKCRAGEGPVHAA